MSHDRREFLGTLMAAGIAPMVVRPGETAAPAGRLTARADSPFDVSWAEKLNGKHRAVFDSTELSLGLGLIRALIWIKDYADVYNTTPAEMNAVVVLRHNAIWLVMNNEFWAKHQIGALTKIIDPNTKLPVTRNPVVGPNPFGFPAVFDDSLTKVLAGSTVLACNLAFSLLVVPKVKADLKLDDAKARETALLYVIPGVKLQPSGVFATLRAQEAGCRYIMATDA